MSLRPCEISVINLHQDIDGSIRGCVEFSSGRTSARIPLNDALIDRIIAVAQEAIVAELETWGDWGKA